MAYSLQLLRALIDEHPDRAVRLKAHVDALEASIEAQPAFCLQHVRTLFEAAHATIAPKLGIALTDDESFAARNSKLIKAMDFAMPGHPEEAKIGTTIAKLLGSINGTAAALGELSNIPNLRHGGSLDWATLSRQHAIMLGGLCDTLVAFLFDVAWSRAEEVVVETPTYDESQAFNYWFDDEYGNVEVAGSIFPSSLVMHRLDITQYDAIRQEWDSINAEFAAVEAE